MSGQFSTHLNWQAVSQQDGSNRTNVYQNRMINEDAVIEDFCILGDKLPIVAQDEDNDGDNAASAAAQLRMKVTMSHLNIILLNLSFFGINLMFLVLSVVVVPAQVATMVGNRNKGSILGGVIAGGAVLTFISGPLVGMKSDRLTSKFGRRRPVMVVALISLCIGLLGMALSAPNVHFNKFTLSENNTQDYEMCTVDLVKRRCRANFEQNNSFARLLNSVDDEKVASEQHAKNYNALGLFIIFYFLVIVSYVCVITPYNAFIADKTNPNQRGTISGVMGCMILLGNICGAALGLFLTKIGVLCTYGIIIVILIVCIFITVTFIHEQPSKCTREPIDCKAIFFAFWSPLKKSDFFWVFITRFLMQQGLSTTVGFLEYWLNDMIHLPFCWNSAQGVSVLLIPLLLFASISAPLCGYISDRINKRKPLIMLASIVMATVAAILASVRGPYAYIISIGSALFFGIAFGAYQAVDFALLMDVLPEEHDKSRDIAVWQQALVLPQALAVPIGGLILDSFERVNCEIGLGYIIVFIITSLYFLLSGIFVSKIKLAK